MERQAIELAALGFQALMTAVLSLVHYGLWRQQRRAYFLTWAVAWALYAVRLAFISAYIVERHEAWLFLHQLATGWTALLLLFAALQFSRAAAWRPRYLALGAAWAAWSWVATFRIASPMVAGISAVAVLSLVTLWTGVVFWQYRRAARSAGATVLAFTFTLWGIHHLDYPLLRPLGTAVLFGVFADVLFLMATAVGTLVLVVASGRRELEARTAQLEQLTRLLLTAQEDERKRLARELHDEAGQILTAVKIDLDLAGRSEASAMIGRAITQVRDLSNLLRPSVLDDLGLGPALRALAEDFAARTRVRLGLELPEPLPPLPDDTEVAVYRIVQEALTNVARHAAAGEVHVRLDPDNGAMRIVVEDDGRGPESGWTPQLGLMGMRERVTALGGAFAAGPREPRGFRLEITLPKERAA